MNIYWINLNQSIKINSQYCVFISFIRVAQQRRPFICLSVGETESSCVQWIKLHRHKRNDKCRSFISQMLSLSKKIWQNVLINNNTDDSVKWVWSCHFIHVVSTWFETSYIIPQKDKTLYLVIMKCILYYKEIWVSIITKSSSFLKSNSIWEFYTLVY